MDRKAYVVGVVAGAGLGAAIGHLCFTRVGHQRLAHMSDLIDRVLDEVARARPLWLKGRLAIEEYAQQRRRSAMSARDDARSRAAFRQAG